MPKADILKRMLESSVDDTVQAITAMDLFNAALRDLAPAARLPGKATISFSKAAMSTDLPPDIIEVREVVFSFNSGVVRSLSELAEAYGIEMMENQSIEWAKELPDDGTITIRYYRYPKTLIALDESPDLPEPFHDALVYYSTREILDADDEDGSKADRKYRDKKMDLDIFTRRRGVTAGPAISSGRPPWLRR